MAAVGFSVNLLTLFGLILAIGIVVDDAIVYRRERIHHIARGRLSAREATIQAMREVTGPIFGITFVLMAVFCQPRSSVASPDSSNRPVRVDDRGDGAHQRGQRSHAEAGAVCAVAAAAVGRAQRVLPRLQPRLPALRGRLRGIIACSWLGRVWRWPYSRC
jgi:hypothetical protein